nr:hypothetical protein [Spongiactinospora gelatinilytica]
MGTSTTAKYECRRAGHRAADVEPAGAGGTALAQQYGGQGQHGHRDRHVDEEDPLPAEHVGEHPAGQQRSGRAERAGAGPDRQRPVAFRAFRERGRHQGERGGRQHGRRYALRDAGGDQRTAVPGEAAGERGEQEQHHPGEEQPAVPEQVGHPAGEQQQAAEAEQVRAEHPLQRRGVEPEVGLDGGEGKDDDLPIQGDHEESGTQEGKRGPSVACRAGGGQWGRLSHTAGDHRSR